MDTPTDAPTETPAPAANGEGEADQSFDQAVFMPRLPPSTKKSDRESLVKLRELAATLSEFRRSKKGELPPEARIAIVTAVACGVSRNAVADAFGISAHTVRNALDRWENRHSTASKPRSGRPKKLTPADEMAITAASQQQHMTSKDLAMSYNVSKGTIRRVLKKKYSKKTPGAPAEETPVPVPQTPVPLPPVIQQQLHQAPPPGFPQGLPPGFHQGMQQGTPQGMQQGMQQSMQQGMSQGMQQGMQQGMPQGMPQGMQAPVPLPQLSQLSGL